MLQRTPANQENGLRHIIQTFSRECSTSDRSISVALPGKDALIAHARGVLPRKKELYQKNAPLSDGAGLQRWLTVAEILVPPASTTSTSFRFPSLSDSFSVRRCLPVPSAVHFSAHPLGYVRGLSAGLWCRRMRGVRSSLRNSRNRRIVRRGALDAAWSSHRVL